MSFWFVFALRVIAVIGVCGVLASPASAGRFDDETLATFETYCLATDPSDRVPLLARAGARELPPKFAQPFLQPQNGKAYKLLRGEFDAVVALTDKGVCSVFNGASDGRRVIDALKLKYKNKLISSAPAAENETQDVYLLAFSQQKHFAVATKQNSTRAGILLHAVPGALVKIPESEWPR